MWDLVEPKPARKTICYGFAESKKALLVALCRMEIAVQEVQEIERGERILGGAHLLEITVDLERVTARVTSMTVRAKKGLLVRDRATAEEIIHQTDEIVQKLVSAALASPVSPPALPEPPAPAGGREAEGFFYPHLSALLP